MEIKLFRLQNIKKLPIKMARKIKPMQVVKPGLRQGPYQVTGSSQSDCIFE